MKKELICISCPQGCHLTAEQDSTGAWLVSGNKCPRGKVYAEQEMTAPRRTVTAVIATGSAKQPFLAVRTDNTYPKEAIPALLNKLYTMKAELPVKRGDVIWENVEGSGVNVIASESLDA